MTTFSVWREADILPPGIGLKIPDMRAGDHAETILEPGEVTDTWDPPRQISVNPSRFDRQNRHGLVVEPRLGRFYPQDFFQGVHGISSDSAQPVGITGLTRERLNIDINHALARFPLQVQFRLDQVLPGYDRRGAEKLVSQIQAISRHSLQVLQCPLPFSGCART